MWDGFNRYLAKFCFNMQFCKVGLEFEHPPLPADFLSELDHFKKPFLKLYLMTFLKGVYG